MNGHDTWLRQIDAELDGELGLPEQAALARHLATCASCAGARASHLEMRVALASAAGQPYARRVPRPVIRGRVLALCVAVSLALGAAIGWATRARWEGPRGALEASRAAIVVQ